MKKRIMATVIAACAGSVCRCVDANRSGRENTRPGTLAGYCYYIDSYIKPQLDDEQVSLVTTQDIQHMYCRLKKEDRVHKRPELATTG